MKKKFISSMFLLSVMSGSVWAQNTAKNNSVNKDTANVISRNIQIEPSETTKSVDEITKKVIETTYKSYPQQTGQPTIIINNIILPSDYNQQGGTGLPARKNDMRAPRGERNPNHFNHEDEQADFRAWQRERGASVRDEETGEWRKDYSKEAFGAHRDTNENRDFIANDMRDEEERNPKNDKKRRRNSGTWFIPMVGIHASGFDANIKDDKYEGRTGWNAGFDVRMRAKRFFVQPGLHYFNSAMEVTNKDSVNTDNFTDGPRIHSLKLPVMLGIYLTKANSGFFKLNVKGGGSATYLIDVDKSDIPQFNKRNLNDFSYGVIAGLGFEFGPVALDLNHEWGVSSFFKNTDKKNNIARVTLGIKF
jgi:hypothetical protein